jgi:phage shock protein PspC (stress-responsive transcriptional regulator)
MTTATTGAPLARAGADRVLGGVCAGLARRYGLSPGWLRVAFAAAALVGGVGVLVYLAAWLIVPGEGESGRSGAARGIVVLAQACAAAVGLATLAALAAAATLFGFGWAVVAVAAAILGGVLIVWGRLGPGWALLPLAAMLVPSVALAAGGLHLHPQMGAQRFAPPTAAGIARARYESGLGTLLVDLRRTALPATGAMPMRIDAGVRRTIVALPHDRCVHVAVTYDVARSIAEQAADTLIGRPDAMRINVFDAHAGSGTGRLGDPGGVRGPALHVDFASAGGSLYVRDYPDAVDPQAWPDWPGYGVVRLEPRPDTAGRSKRAARRQIRHWRTRRAAQERSRRRLAALLAGPCAKARRR